MKLWKPEVKLCGNGSEVVEAEVKLCGNGS